MKTSHNNTLLLVLTLSFILTSCGQADDIPETEHLGALNARMTISEIHMQYLDCYALGKKAKKECLEPMISIHKKDRKDEKYIQAFQFESEKLGFKSFLNDRYLPCEQINDGPEYIRNIQAYLVKCSPLNQYVMGFDYETGEWKLLQRRDF